MCLYGVLSGLSAVALCTSGITYLVLVLLHHLLLFGVIREGELRFILVSLGWSETLFKVEVSVLAAYAFVVFKELSKYMVGCRCKFKGTFNGLIIP